MLRWRTDDAPPPPPPRAHAALRLCRGDAAAPQDDGYVNYGLRNLVEGKRRCAGAQP